MINLKEARRIIAAAEAKAGEIRQPLILAWIGSIGVSINKAFTARAFDISTADL